MSLRRAAMRLVCLALVLTSVSCAARRFVPPTDPGAALPDFSDIHAAVTRACAGVQTFTVELGLSGSVGGERVRGRVIAGFMRPDAMRLEGVAPFGPPAFVLVSSAGDATLVLPRDNAVLDSAPPEEVLEALTGVRLGPPDLRAVLTGCVTPVARAVTGVLHANGWASIVTDAGATLYLQRDGGVWRLRAARRDPWTIEYAASSGAFPANVRLRTEDGRVPVDLLATLSQIEANVDLSPSAFAVTVPPSARAISLEDLRQSGPLRGQAP